MTKEDELIDQIFGDSNRPKFRGRKIGWCDLCEVFTISCKKCSGTNCNCMCCDDCRKDQEDFKNLHPWPEFFMTNEERKTIEKYRAIKRMLPEFLSEERPFNAAEAKDKGRWCDAYEEYF
jgi:hypothetical protein